MIKDVLSSINHKHKQQRFLIRLDANNLNAVEKRESDKQNARSDQMSTIKLNTRLISIT